MGANHTYRYVKTSGLGITPKYWPGDAVTGTIYSGANAFIGNGYSLGMHSQDKTFSILKIDSSNYYLLSGYLQFALYYNNTFNRVITDSKDKSNIDHRKVRTLFQYSRVDFLDSVFDRHIDTLTNFHIPLLVDLTIGLQELNTISDYSNSKMTTYYFGIHNINPVNNNISLVVTDIMNDSSEYWCINVGKERGFTSSYKTYPYRDSATVDMFTAFGTVPLY